MAEIAALTKLKVLDVEGSDLTDLSVEQMTECVSLQVLNVRATQVTQDCVSRLRKIMIGTRIIL